jgi:hypothetical protein
MTRGKWAASALALAAVVVSLWPLAGISAESKRDYLVSAEGALHVPDGYRTCYESLGSWSVAGEGAGAKEMHVVYASPHAIGEGNICGGSRARKGGVGSANRHDDGHGIPCLQAQGLVCHGEGDVQPAS